MTSILRLIRPIPALSLIPIVIVAPCTNSEFEYSTLRLRKSLESFYLSFLPGVKDRSRGRSRSFVVGVGFGTSSCWCMKTRVLPGNKSSIFQNYLLPIVCPLSFDFMGEVGRKHVYFGQPESFHLCMLIVDRTLLPFFRVLLWSGPCLSLEKDQLS